MELPFNYLIPEIILLAMAAIVTLLGLSPKDSVRKLTQSLAALACLVALIFAVIGGVLRGGPLPTPANAFPRRPLLQPQLHHHPLLRHRLPLRPRLLEHARQGRPLHPRFQLPR